MEFDPLRALVEFLTDQGFYAEWRVNWVHLYITIGNGTFHFVNISVVDGGIRVGGWDRDIPLALPNSFDLLLERLNFYNSYDSTKIDCAPSG